MTVGLALVGEDEGHFRAVTGLVDRALVASIPWLDGILEDARRWRGLKDHERWYKYDPQDVAPLRPTIIDGVPLKRHGHIDGEPTQPEARMWRGILLAFCHADPRPEVVVLARDLDGHPLRRAGMAQVRDRLPWPFPIVLATPEPEVEAWHVAGFEPEDSEEHVALSTIASELSFDPTRQSHRLTSHPNDARTDAKRVLERLCDGDEARVARCLDDPDRLRAGGDHNGLTAFLADVEQRLLPVFGRPAS